MGHTMHRTCLWAYVDSDGPDQPVHPHTDQRLHCPLIESLGSTASINGEQRPRCYFAHAQDILNLHNLHMFKGNFLLDAAHMIFNP